MQSTESCKDPNRDILQQYFHTFCLHVPSCTYLKKNPQFLDIFCFKYKICTRNVCKVVLAGLQGVVQRMALNSHFTGKIIQRRKKSNYIKSSALNTFGEIKGKILRNDENENHLGKGSHKKSFGAFCYVLRGVGCPCRQP